MTVDENDMNSWEQYRAGNLCLDCVEKPYALFRAELPGASGKFLIFRCLWGWAEVYYGGKLAGKKTTDEPEEFGVKLPADAVNETLTVLIKADPKGQAGIYGKVVL